MRERFVRKCRRYIRRHITQLFGLVGFTFATAGTIVNHFDTVNWVAGGPLLASVLILWGIEIGMFVATPSRRKTRRKA